uniref:metallophosphoesterase n=1 Tax=Candidatus Electrothrix sp. TaxID=2170559 RepID=UPI00405639D6
MKIIFEGDLQVSSSVNEYNSESFHYLARKAYIDWFLSQPELNNEDVLYWSLGDLTESSIPSPRDTQLLVYFFSQMKNKQKYIIAGNHDYNRGKGSYSFDPLTELEGVTAFTKPCEKDIDELSFKILPYYYDFVYPELKSMRENYESYKGEYDFIIFHFEDETQSFGDNQGINLSKIKGKRIGGHIHVGGENYLMSPVPNKSNEILPERYLYLLDTETSEIEKILIPNFLDYGVVNYPNPIEKKSDALYTAWEIRDYVNKQDALSLYKEQWGDNFFIHKMSRKGLVESSDTERSNKVRTIKELWSDYKSSNKIDSNVSKLVENAL